MNLFQKLTEENQAKVRFWDENFKIDIPNAVPLEKSLSELLFSSEVPIELWFLLKDILGYDTVDQTYLNAFKQ